MNRFYALAVALLLIFQSVPTFANESFASDALPSFTEILYPEVELTTLNIPGMSYGMSFALPVVTNFAEAVALLPQYATITTNPLTEQDPLPINWELVPGFTFDPLPGGFNIVEWLVTLPQNVSNSAGIPVSGSVMVLIRECELEQAEAVARVVVGNIPVSNATTADDFINAIETAIVNPLVNAEWYIDFSVSPATPTSNGTITGTIRLTLDTKHMDIAVNRTWTHILATRRNAAQLAVDAISVSNITTAADFTTAVESVVTGSGIEVSLFGNFNLVPATTKNEGQITGVIRLTYGADFLDIIINRTIRVLSELWIVGISVQQMVNALLISNETTPGDITEAVEIGISAGASIEVSYNDFSLTPATETSTGRLTVTIVLTRGAEYHTFAVDRPIPRTRIATELFLEWDYGMLAAPRSGNLWPATRSVNAEYEYPHTNLEFYYADGVRALLGRQQNDRLAVNVPNRGSGASSNYNDWYTDSTVFHTVTNVAGWVITLSTIGWENINFSANQASSNNGPGEFGLAYRIGTDGAWTSYGGYPEWKWDMVSVRSDISHSSAPGITFNHVQLPDAIANQQVVQIKLYISSDRTRLGGAHIDLPRGEGNTSINNIVFRGERVNEAHTVIFDPNGGEFVNSDDMIRVVQYDGDIGVLPRAVSSMFSREGYRFMGWFENIQDKNTRRRDYDKVSGDITLFAKWTEIPDTNNFRVGDADNSGSVTSADATSIAKHLAGQQAYICVLAADVNGDGDVRTDDVALLAQWLVGRDVRHLIAY